VPEFIVFFKNQMHSKRLLFVLDFPNDSNNLEKYRQKNDTATHLVKEKMHSK